MTATKPARQTAAPKPGRSMRVVSADAAGVLVKLATSRGSDLYLVRRIACEIGGEGFAFGKIDADRPACHHARLLGDGGTVCDCAGITFGGACKHAACLPVLRRLGHI